LEFEIPMVMSMLPLYTRTPEYRWQGLMEISENLALMYRQNFKNFPKNVWTAAGMGP
jgi:hypothetical protein